MNASNRPTKPAAGADMAKGLADADGERIAKFLARAGIASRRDAERMIEEGRVRVNGTILTTPAFKVTPGAKILVDGKAIAAPEPPRLWRYHKPRGLVTSHRDELGRPTVFDHLPPDMPRVISVGRLDINSEGLLLLTNDGGLARAMELPATGWLRKYRVRVYGRPEPDILARLRDGIVVDGVSYGSIEAELDKVIGDNAWITVGLREGKNREIKRVMEALDLKVNRLIRTAYGPFALGNLMEGYVDPVPAKTMIGLPGMPSLAEAAPASEPEKRKTLRLKPEVAAKVAPQKRGFKRTEPATEVVQKGRPKPGRPEKSKPDRQKPEGKRPGRRP
jgi:23S rRNA pseudouridine2605 synthase